jgi:CRISPR-associated exonuclease Cas4
LYSEDDYILLSGIQHFAFCRRQWALIHIEQLWTENQLTAEGRLMHERAHNPFLTEKRKDVLIVREMAVHSSRLGVSGQCDVVEFTRDEENGVPLFGRKGKWSPMIVEYKRGKSKADDCDRLQLALQAICLEEMLACPQIKQSCVYYGETKHREYVDLTDELRDNAETMIAEMHEYYKRRFTPKVKAGKSCKRCSLYDLCLPSITANTNVTKYIESALLE